jgi:hypothetical protein
MNDVVDESTFEVECPHCGKTFAAELMAGSAPRYAGFKCSHCKLFVPYERADEQDLLKPPD